jgi:hypothetical protein
MDQLCYSMLNDDWEVEDGSTFVSPLNPLQPAQVVIFSDRVKNGSITADIILLDSRKGQAGEDNMEASLIFRYVSPEGFYYAGTGAFATRFFIAKVRPGPLFQVRTFVGQRNSLRLNKAYRLRVQFSGSRTTLYENDVQQLVLIDDAYQIGQCGLASWRTQARFADVRIRKEQPVAFVVMPFLYELDFVHRTVNDVVEEYGIRCVRADEIFFSRPVMEDVKEQIARADLVIVDFTGKNPNVYYEAGLAEAWNKDWIVLAQSDDDLTFDVRHIRAIRYSNAMGADVQLKNNLRKALETLGYRRETS